jgi:hypothetical protein
VAREPEGEEPNPPVGAGEAREVAGAETTVGGVRALLGAMVALRFDTRGDDGVPLLRDAAEAAAGEAGLA